MICPSCQADNDVQAPCCFACGARLEPALAGLRQGALFASRYEILGSLGRGGMGMVYRAYDREIGEEVAIKVLRPDVARQSSRVERRFRAEIRLARRVRHRNVCSVYGDGVDRGLLYICMELVEGENLARTARASGGLPADEAWDVVRQVADGLRAIHQAGVVHRDLKTGNLMRDREGVVRVMDFGIAKHCVAGTDGNTVTASGTLMGTPEYMSPEQLRGEPVDFSSDIYSFGIVTYELFTGTLPFRGGTPVVTILRQLDAPPRLDVPRLPPAARAVLAEALAKDPSRRYRTAADMRQALHAARLESLAGGRDAAREEGGEDQVGDTRTVPPLVPPRAEAPWARVLIGVLGVVALAVHLLGTSLGSRPHWPAADTHAARPAGPPAPALLPLRPLSASSSVPAALVPPAVLSAGSAGPVGALALAPPPLLLTPAPLPAPVPEPATVVPGVLAALVLPVDTGRVYDKDDVDVPPRLILGRSAPYPEWGPPLSPGRRISITASYTVTETGDVTDIDVERGDEALRAVLVEISRWKYEPGLKDGVPVKVRLEARHTFVGG